MMMMTSSPLLFLSAPSHRFSLYITAASSSTMPLRRKFLATSIGVMISSTALNFPGGADLLCWSKPVSEFFELRNSGGVKALELRLGEGEVPVTGDQVYIHYYGRLAAKQGWRFDSTYDHKDESGVPIPFTFILGSGKVISGIEAAVKSMKVGGILRVVIPPSEGYQNTSQEPIPPNFFDRQRLFTTIFNPTRIANGEGSTLGTLVFDIELVNLRHQYVKLTHGDGDLKEVLFMDNTSVVILKMRMYFISGFHRSV